MAGEVDQLGGGFVFCGTSKYRPLTKPESALAVAEPLGEWDPGPP